jgi:hypothetical protein
MSAGWDGSDRFLLIIAFIFPVERNSMTRSDCVVPSFLEIPGSIVKRYFEEMVERNQPSETSERKAELISQLMSTEALETGRRNIQSDIDRAGILSFSKVRDDILMWAHYADRHKGLCFEFDGSANCKFFGEAQPVEYRDYRPMPLDESAEKQMARVILTKSPHWDYEQEFRIFRPGRARAKIEFPAALLTGVIFGCGMPENVRRSVRRWASDGGCRVAFFETRPAMGKFGLDIVRV